MTTRITFYDNPVIKIADMAVEKQFDSLVYTRIWIHVPVHIYIFYIQLLLVDVEK